MLADKALRDLISVEEIDKYTEKNERDGSHIWAHKAKMEFRTVFVPTNPLQPLRQFTVTFTWGTKAMFNLHKGKPASLVIEKEKKVDEPPGESDGDER